jgi:imidazolonepropionase-like amidohydrolase
MTYGDLGPMLTKESPFYHLPSGSFSGALNRHRWRETVTKAKQYLKDQAAHEAASEAGADFGGPPRQSVPEEVIKLVQRKVALRTEASSVEQMRDMIALAKELEYDLILDNVHEAWLMAGELAAAKVQTVLTPRSSRRPTPGREETTGSSIETSGQLEKAGVPFAVSPLSTSVSLDGIPGRDLTSLPLEAAFAVRGGATEQTALAGLTIVPARMLGLSDRIGSIEEGKDADLLILTGPPLDYRTAIDKALVGGKVYYDRTRDRILPDTEPRP